MKVNILTEGGPGIGLGHIVRCNSLYDTLLEQNCDINYFIVGKLDKTQIIRDRDAIFANWQNVRFLLENINNNDFCIVDSYLANQIILKTISNIAKNVVFIDDTNRIKYPKGIIVNPSLDIEGVGYPSDCKLNILSGSKYVILRKPFQVTNEKRIRKSVCRVLITVGGYDYKKIIPMLIYHICNNYPEIEFDLVTGNEFAIEINSTNNKDNINFYCNVNEDQMKDLMEAADFAITAAGQTIYELISTGTPFFPIQVAENQFNNINSLRKLGLVKDIVASNSASFITDLKKSFQTLMDYYNRCELVDQYRGLIDGQGSVRIINELFRSKSSSLRIRKAINSDCYTLFEWVNDDLVRKNSFNSGQIDYDSHKKWFEEKLCNSNILFYIALLDNEPIGQVRIDIEDGCGIIDYSIDKRNRGNGFGAELLKLVEKDIKDNGEAINKLFGNVKCDNIASQRAFQKAGYNEQLSSSGSTFIKFVKFV